MAVPYPHAVDVERFATQHFPKKGDEVLLRGLGLPWKAATVEDDAGGSHFSVGEHDYLPYGEGKSWRWAESEKNGRWIAHGTMSGSVPCASPKKMSRDLEHALCLYLVEVNSRPGLYRTGDVKFSYNGYSVERVD